MPQNIPIADFRRGARTNPSWQKASQGSALDMVNIAVEGQGRPVSRMGYVVDDTLEVEGLGDQLIKAHDLGSPHRSPVSRTFRLSSHQDYVINKGRLFVSGGGQFSNKWIDLEDDDLTEFNLVLPELTDALNYTRTPQDIGSMRDGDGYLPGGRVVTNWFSLAYNFESIKFGFETTLSNAKVIDFPTFTGGTFDYDTQFEVYLPNQPIPEWVDRVNFYMQTEPGVSNPHVNAIFNPNGTDRRYIKFGAIRFIVDSQRENFSFADNPITTPVPLFDWHEGDTAQIPSDFESHLYPDGRGDYWRAVPTLTGFYNVELKTIDTSLAIVGSAAEKLHPFMLYAERLWGWDRDEQLLRFSELGKYETFPADYAVELSASGQSHVEALVPAPTVSAFFVFKQDAIHVIRGSGVVDGLRMKSIADTDLDASGVMLQHGTLSPRTIISGDNGIYFISRDKKLKYLTIDGYGNTNVKDVGIAIDDYLAELTIEEQKDLIAFLYDNCYHIIMPGYVLVLDIQRRYWTRITWDLKDAFWSEGGAQGESILYAIRNKDSFGRFTNDIVRLYEGFQDEDALIPCEWESQDVQLPYETNVTGIIVQHTSEPQELSVDLYMDDVLIKEFRGTPQKGNHFRISTYGYGHRARVRLKSDDGIPLINLLALEIP